MASASVEHKSSDFQVELERGGALARRRSQILSDGSYLFEDELRVEGELVATVITCTAWLLELFELHAGSIAFVNGEDEARAMTKRFGVFYPPFSITKPCLRDVKAHLIGVAGSGSIPAEFVAGPIVFDSKFAQAPSGVAEIVEILRSGENVQRMEINKKPSLVSLKAKRLIDENYLVYPSIARIAARLGVTHEHLSRQFKEDFGMSPSKYLRQLRVADAPLKLAQGEEIVNVSQDVGYNDLSRFYKQFRQTTDTSPGECKTILRPRRK